MGGFSINLLNCNTDEDTRLHRCLCSCSFYPTLNFPRWITPTTKTLIDSIFCNNASNSIISGNITTSISDHLTQFLLVPDQLKDIWSLKLEEIRSFHNFDPKTFEKDLQKIDWNNILQLPSENPNPFFSKVETLLDKHCPLKKPRKIKQKWKSWIMPALSNSIRMKNKRYKQFC